MTLLPISIPRASEVRQFSEEPLGFLARARSSLGNMFVIRDAGPIFSRAPDCAGAIAVFGPAHHRAVLSDIDLYGMPVSAAQRLALPPNLFNLNSGLHSMRGEQHAQHQRLLMHLLSERSIEDQHGAVSTGLETFAQRWRIGQRIGLLAEMRKLALEVSSRLLF
ncbi:MAG TPA: cytochrome P450, partial [Blastocatellia bacterium]|nr:cytochrome P450 [Blastocatellia bacterium]